jgi:hypothetical protein
MVDVQAGIPVLGDLLEILEMHVGVLLEHFTEVDQQYVNSPVVLEAASSIIFAGTQTESKGLCDLHMARSFR